MLWSVNRQHSRAVFLAGGMGPAYGFKPRYPLRSEGASGLYEGQQCNERPHRCVWLFTPRFKQGCPARPRLACRY